MQMLMINNACLCIATTSTKTICNRRREKRVTNETCPTNLDIGCDGALFTKTLEQRSQDASENFACQTSTEREEDPKQGGNGPIDQLARLRDFDEVRQPQRSHPTLITNVPATLWHLNAIS